MRQTARPTQSPDPSPPIATQPHPRSSGRRQTPPPPRAVRRLQIPPDPRYTPSASGVPLALRQTVVATRFSQIQHPDAPTPFEISGLGRTAMGETRPNRQLAALAKPRELNRKYVAGATSR